MATLNTSKQALAIHFTGRERRVLGRPHLSIDRSRLLSAELVEFPGKGHLGVRISKFALFGGLLGDYRSNSKRIIVLGRNNGESALLIKFSHPNIDELWVCGPKATSWQQDLAKLL